MFFVLTILIIFLLDLKKLSKQIDGNSKCDGIIINPKLKNTFNVNYLWICIIVLILDLTKLSDIAIFINIMFFSWIIYNKNDYFFINPFLDFLGYSVYNCSFKHENTHRNEPFFVHDIIIITKLDIQELNIEELEYIRLTKYIYMVHKLKEEVEQ